MPDISHDDVIRIRIDLSRAVRDFLDILTQQAAEGETRAPAKPRATSVYREIAPYRLVEFSYVGGGIGEVQGAYLGLPDGTIYAVSDEIPEPAVDALVAGELADLPPVYVYVVLDEPAPSGAIDGFLDALSRHVGQPLVGVLREDGTMTARGYAGADPDAVTPDAVTPGALAAAVARAQGETALHLTKEQVLDRFVARSESPDGRAFARVAYDFARHVMAFTSAADRDDFVAWSRKLCQALDIQGLTWESLGFPGLVRPAEPAPQPRPDLVVTPMVAPRQYQGGRPWRAFDDAGALVDRPLAAGYWAHVAAAVAAAEAGAGRLDGWVVRG